MSIVVTGAAGFVGANLVKALNERGDNDIVAVDNLSRGAKFSNLVDCQIADYFDKKEFIEMLAGGVFDGEISAILHQGACADTMEADGRYMMENNYRYSAQLLEFCQAEAVPLIYASSAAVYGAGPTFSEVPQFERPLNVYGWSKAVFDNLVRRRWDDNTTQVVGLRYFNVYGVREAHKGRMASVAFHFFHQYQSEGRVKLFEGSGGYEAGEQRRDFVSVEDVVKVNLYFLDHSQSSGIFNVGTGRAQTFNDVAAATINALRVQSGDEAQSQDELRRHALIDYVSFPAGLRERYQSYTQADIARLRRAGYAAEFLTVEEGVGRYVQRLLAAK